MRAGVLAAALLLPAVGEAQQCSPFLPGGRQVESARFLLAYRSVPEKIAVGKHFALELAVCPKAGVPGPESLRVDAHMPEHRHGMNYKAQVAAAPGGRYKAEGLMFHMPGRWELVFDVRSGGTTDRLTQSVTLE
ncbi:MAG: hypothetical protein JSS40_05695 [Proteobacteria bacterium]|nr:hypothetical protein [Pseudomonadota bacterium]